MCFLSAPLPADAVLLGEIQCGSRFPIRCLLSCPHRKGFVLYCGTWQQALGSGAGDVPPILLPPLLATEWLLVLYTDGDVCMRNYIFPIPSREEVHGWIYFSPKQLWSTHFAFPIGNWTHARTHQQTRAANLRASPLQVCYGWVNPCKVHIAWVNLGVKKDGSVSIAEFCKCPTHWEALGWNQYRMYAVMHQLSRSLSGITWLVVLWG